MVAWVPSNEVSHLSTFEKYVGVGTALGIVFGAVFGQAIFGGVGVGVAIGMIFGTAIGAALGRLSRPTVVLLGNGRHLRGGVGTGRGEERSASDPRVAWAG